MNKAAGGKRTAALSIRARLVLGAGLIGALAILSALVTAYEAGRTAHEIRRIEEAQIRIEQLAEISKAISDYAIIAVDSAATDLLSGSSPERLREKGRAVYAAFGKARRTIVQSEGSAEHQINRLEQMEAMFRSLEERISRVLEKEQEGNLSASISMFSRQFSFLLRAAIADEQSRRRAAVARIGEIRHALTFLAGAVIILAPVLMILFSRRLIAPILTRIGRMGEVTNAIAKGDFRIDLPAEPDDELGELFRRVNIMAKELARRKNRVDADYARLNEIVREKTKELIEANRRLAEIDSHRRRFFADISHELRTPLTVILAEAELAGQGSREEVNRSLNVILARTRRLHRRIDDLLRVARSESGQIELDLQPVSLGVIAEEAADDIAPHMQKKRIRLERQTDAGHTVMADRDWIRQVIVGLLENAVKHAPEDSTIGLVLSGNGKDSIVEIWDQGPGLDHDLVESAFDRFRKGRLSRGNKGFGIGLALAKWVIEEHGGAIELHNRPHTGLGLRVVVRLPLVTRAKLACAGKKERSGADDRQPQDSDRGG